MEQIIQIVKQTWRFEDGFVRFFLLEGRDKAVLIDTGANCPNAAEMAGTLTDKPILLLNTHADGDHTSGTAAFSHIHMHPVDYEKCAMGQRFPNTSLVAVNDGDVIDLGERPLQIIHIPGHTYGSIAILDINHRALYAGDSVQTGHIFMFGPTRDVDSFDSSLVKLLALQAAYDTIYACHGEAELPSTYVEKVLAAWRRVRNGEVGFERQEMFGTTIRVYTTEGCGFYMEA